MKIGPFEIANPVIAAPMAGVTDKPYRQLCRQNGAGLVVSEMLTSKPELRKSTKSIYRSNLTNEPEPIVIQLVGTDPTQMAAAAQHNVENGAQIIDINMGCPAKKVCKQAAGSALLENEPLVAEILQAVVQSVSVPVTLKIRTGANPQKKNALTIAKIAEDAGVQSLAMHGRTRQCKFVGAVEYDTIAQVKNSVSIPVVANGDIDSPQQALKVLQHTSADGVMIGRAAQGQPWLFNQIAVYLKTGLLIAPPDALSRANTIVSHIAAIHSYYRPDLAVRLARKHIKWYLHHWESDMSEFARNIVNQSEQTSTQLAVLEEFLFASIENLNNKAA